MDDPSAGTTVLLLVLLIVLLICSGCFSATETALFCLNRIERRRLGADKSTRSQLIARALERPRELLSTILFGNTLINVATSAAAALFFARIIKTHSLSAAIVVDSLLVFLIGDIIPKTIAVSQAKPLARAAIIPFHIFSKLTRPVVVVFDQASRWILRLLKVPEEAGGALSPSELDVLFEEAGRKETITSQERRIARNIMRFSETTAAEIMTPRVDVVAALLDISREGLEELMSKARHSRIPICEGSIDHIVGFVSTKEFFLNPDRQIRELVKPVAIFPEGARIHRVFQHMQKRLINMAVIVNEYGVTSGIVTMEDLLEEIVGEIYDEYEKAEELIRPVGPDEWFVICRAPIEQVNQVCGLDLPEGDSVTLNGYLCDEFGEIPAPGRTIERNGGHFIVVESKRGRIVSCRIKQIHMEASRDDA
ncbi:MAG: HlyC/CorC family transporter [Desulfobacterales bacterium]|nr:HlyC/CorC family transporter [Desulfobacterales bacterium]